MLCLGSVVHVCRYSLEVTGCDCGCWPVLQRKSRLEAKARGETYYQAEDDAETVIQSHRSGRKVGVLC